MTKNFIFVTGGVCSSLGKGLSAASIGMLLEKHGVKIAMLKLDPYLNVDPGTMSPYQHGEVYVTDDGAETDLDLGHYLRYTDSPLSRASNITSGQIYNTVIRRERRGDYLGKTVQVIPHITDEIKKRIHECDQQEEGIQLTIVEIGGTVGDIESLPFMEAIRQLRHENKGRCLNIHLTYVPFLKAAQEFKTKPSQHSVQILREIGIFPDIMLCRSEKKLPDDVKDKISLFCNVTEDAVIEEVDVEYSIYEVPIKLKEQGLDTKIAEFFNFPIKEIDLSEWENLINVIKKPKGKVTIGVVGKYVQHQDAYKSIYESLSHAALSLGYHLEIKRFEADKLPLDSEQLLTQLKGCDGYLVPGGFGERGFQGKINTAKYCRENKIPFFGICLGMQVLAVEFARHAAHIEDANSTEVDPGTKNPVISILSQQENVQDFGGTMRLGAYLCELKEGTLAHKAYETNTISERHRHRFEFNNKYLPEMEKAGFIVSGRLQGGELVEIAEVRDHPWMLGVQFHPEFKSKPIHPHPLFKDFMKAAIAHQSA